MSKRRVRPPAVSFALFLVICGMGWVAYEHRDFFRSDPPKELLTREKKDILREEIYRSLETDDCFLELRGALSWRPNEGRYLLDILVVDGELCELRAKQLCEEIAFLIQDEAGVIATVVAYDQAGRELGRKVL
jgi:hypothetical protein